MLDKKKTVAAMSALAALALLGAPAALADEIVLANGDRVSGTILRKESDKLVAGTRPELRAYRFHRCAR